MKKIIIWISVLVFLTSCSFERQESPTVSNPKIIDQTSTSSSEWIDQETTLSNSEINRGDTWESLITKKENTSDSLSEEIIISLDAKRWEYSQKEIRVKKGQKVTLQVNNVDTLHGIAIPDMQLVWNNSIEVDTSVSWEFEFRCANYCGDEHENMIGKIIIE